MNPRIAADGGARRRRGIRGASRPILLLAGLAAAGAPAFAAEPGLGAPRSARAPDERPVESSSDELPERLSSDPFVARVAERLRAGSLTRPEERSGRARALATLGPSAAPALLDALLTGRLEGLDGPRSEAALRDGEREVLEEALRLLGHAVVPGLVAAALEAPAGLARERGLRRALHAILLCGLARDVEQALELAQALDPGEPAALRLQGDLERVVREVARRDAAALRHGVALLDTAPEGLALSVVRGLAASDQRDALQILASEIAGRQALRPLLLSQLARAARSAPRPIDPWIQREARRYLTGSDPLLARAAAGAVAGLEDFDAVPDLIALLDTSGELTREARGALRDLAGRDLGADPGPWKSWHEAEEAWRSRELPLLTRRLEGRDPGAVVGALRELSGRRYRRGELVRLVEPHLHHASPAVRKSACETLFGLGEPSSAPLLVELLADTDPAVSRAAWSALVSLTGQSHPPDPATWRAALTASR